MIAATAYYSKRNAELTNSLGYLLALKCRFWPQRNQQIKETALRNFMCHFREMKAVQKVNCQKVVDEIYTMK